MALRRLWNAWTRAKPTGEGLKETSVAARGWNATKRERDEHDSTEQRHGESTKTVAVRPPANFITKMASSADPQNLSSIMAQMNSKGNKVSKMTDTEVATLEQSVREEVEGMEPVEITKKANQLFQGLSKEKAALMWKVAAEKGEPNASYSYARCLQSGEGVQNADKEQAVKHYEQLARKGHPWSQYALAHAKLLGDGLEKNEKEAFSLFVVSAKNGIIPALHNVANMLAHGKGVEKDEFKAERWYEQAAVAGDPYSKFALGLRYTRTGNDDGEADNSATTEGREGGSACSEVDDILKKRQKGLTYLKEAADAGLPQAQYNLATHLFVGDIIAQDVEAAAEYYEKAAKAGFIWAMINLGNLYMDGFGVEKSVEKARLWFEKASIHSEDAKKLLEATYRYE